MKLRSTHTTDKTEMTIYRILGDGHSHVVECVLRDKFTFVLLMMVLATNLIIVTIPVAMHALDKHVAVTVSYTMAAALIPGYFILLGLLLFRWNGIAPVLSGLKNLDSGQLRVSRSPRLRNIVTGIQCLLFASLLCSSFILRKQLTSLNTHQQSDAKEHVHVIETPIETPVSILPLLRQFISL